MSKFRLLTKDEVVGDCKLDILKKIGINSKNTYMAHLLKTTFYDDDYFLSTTHVVSGHWGYDYSTPDVKEVYYVTGNGNLRNVALSEKNGTYGSEKYIVKDFGVRPVMHYSLLDKIDKNPKRDDDGVLEVEYGEYPQDMVSREMEYSLRSISFREKLRKTGKKYTICVKTVESPWCTYLPMEWEEYEYNGEKYVETHLTEEQKKIWLKVSPIKWYVDEKNKLLVSKNILVAGIDFRKINKFFSLHFRNDIIPWGLTTKKEEEKKEKSDETKVKKLVREIYKCLDGNPNSDKYIKKMNTIIDEYNNKLAKVTKARKNNEMVVESLSSITMDLEFKLNMLLDDVKRHQKKYNNHYEMINALDKYISLINGEKDTEYTNEFIQDLDSIVNICFPFLKKETANSIAKKLINVFKREKKEIIGYIDGNNEISYNSIEEMNLDLRKKMHPILRNLSTSVNKRDVEVEISSSIHKIIYGLFEAPKNNVLSFFLVEINNIYTVIHDLMDELPSDMKEDYKKIIFDIMNMNIDYSKDFNDVANDLKTMWLSLNKVLYRINNYIDEINELENSHMILERLKR